MSLLKFRMRIVILIILHYIHDTMAWFTFRYTAAFFDFDEDGVSDIFVLAENPNRIIAIYNNFENDAFFLKALGIFIIIGSNVILH